MTAKEYRFLMNNKKELTIEDFNELLMENDLENFDPTLDAFRAFDSLVREKLTADCRKNTGNFRFRTRAS
jgi:hypothetical protein